MNLKQLCLGVLILFSANTLFSQHTFDKLYLEFPFAKIYLHKKQYTLCEIQFTDGSTKRVFIEDLIDPERYAVQGFTSDMHHVENVTIGRETFLVKDAQEGKTYKLEASTIQRLELFEWDKEPVVFERLKVQTLNNSFEPVFKDREIMAPLVREGKLNMYVLAVQFADTGMGHRGLSSYPLVYIKRPNDEFAMMPLDITLGSIFSMGKIDDKFLEAFKIAGGDCPEFVAFLEKEKEQMNSVDFQKKARADYNAFIDLKKNEGKKLGKSERQELYYEMDLQYALKLYNIILDKYEELCE